MAAPTYGPTPAPPDVVVSVGTAVVFDGLDADAFNGNPSAILAFRRAVAKTLDASEDDVVDVVATPAKRRRRRRRLDDAAAARVDFDVLVTYPGGSNASLAEIDALDDTTAALTAAVTYGNFSVTLDEEAENIDAATAAFYDDVAVDEDASADLIATESTTDVDVLTLAPTPFYNASCFCLPYSPHKRPAAGLDACTMVCRANVN